MKMLFVYPNIVESPKDISLGIAYLSAVLKKAGHKTALIDCSFGITDEEIINKTRSFKPDLIGVTTASNDFHYAVHIAELLKKNFDLPIICGGIQPTIAPEEVIAKECFDMICVGEGEYPLLELMDSLEGGEKKTDIQNIWFKHDGKIIKNNIRPWVIDLDSLPFPDREIYDYNKYLEWHHNTASLISGRGCPFDCTYCINHFLKKLNKGQYLRFRSVDNVIAEVKETIKKYPQITSIEFYDDTFTLNPNRVREFCEKYSKEVGLPFIINARVNAVDKDMFLLLKKAGCVRASIGVESGDQHIRNDILKRNTTDEQIINTFKWASEAGIKTYSYNMVGIPYENYASIKKTIKLNQIIKPDFVGVSIFNAFKGTDSYELCKKMGWLDENKIATSYFQTTNVKHPNFSDKQLKKIRDRFGFEVFIAYKPARAFIDLFDKIFTKSHFYMRARSFAISKLRLIES